MGLLLLSLSQELNEGAGRGQGLAALYNEGPQDAGPKPEVLIRSRSTGGPEALT